MRSASDGLAVGMAASGVVVGAASGGLAVPRAARSSMGLFVSVYFLCRWARRIAVVAVRVTM